MTTPQTPSGTAGRPTALWRAFLVSSGVFLAGWALCWVNAYVVNDDLPNACGDVRRQSFPPEVACASADGTLSGTNAGWLVALFFASLVVSVLLMSMLAALAAVRRK
ncbi:hypothetical protein [Streptomyces asoensis]|uniref:Integral membrane protein n=1 Tax=Streptomyces asoensis TaxID=249586 RepID=A0ABQ3S529_9ACTN|nr:hypothetical protein [Streptomyces asoensis]GGQ65351.1 hypothetical protein GCM10010496_30900 [Streptomyces asoensis]GHI63229.1 hypothetical protein Saso_48790 [Streptomyces asoensis]